MPEVDLLVKDGKIVTPTAIYDASIAVDQGVIVGIASASALPKARKVIDAKGKIILPGGIDGHVHLSYEKSKTSGEDITSGTGAAAAGGITTICIMPQGWPLTDRLSVFKTKKKGFSGKSRVDFSMHGGFSGGENNDHEKNIRELWKEGVVAIKGYMHNHRPTRSLKASYDGEMLFALQQFAKVNGLAIVHCENEWMQEWNRSHLQAAGKNDAKGYLEFSPPIVEYEAGKRFLYFVRVTGARGMMVHTSLPELVEEAQRGKVEGHQTYVETCPQYLYFTDEDMVRRGIWLKCAPTVRDKARVAKMWEMAERGWIDTMGSDHVPTSREEMSKGDANFWEVGAGMPNIEFMTQSLLTGVNNGWLSLQRVPKMLAEGPAKLFELYPKKGAIQLGSDADIVIADLKKSYKVTQDKIVSKAGWSPFETLTLKGAVVTTIVRGEPVLLDGEIVGKAEHGVFQPRLANHS